MTVTPERHDITVEVVHVTADNLPEVASVSDGWVEGEGYGDPHVYLGRSLRLRSHVARPSDVIVTFPGGHRLVLDAQTSADALATPEVSP